MSILYIIFTMILIINFILIKKSDKKQNLLFWITMSIILILIYNVFASYILTLINVKSNLINLTIVNIIVSLILGIKIYKDKEIQKYYCRVKDIVSIILMLVIVIGIEYKQYGFPMSIKYETTDPAIHYSAAKDFYNNQQTPVNDENRMMPAAYVNTGILMLLASDFMVEENFYIIYIFFDLAILYLIGITFYIGITNNVESKLKSCVAMIFSILFILGYPLNSMIFGYAYLSVGILFMIALIVMAPYSKNKELKELAYCIIFFALNFGIFFSYYFFVPVIYVSFGLYMLFDMVKNRKAKNVLSIINIKNIIEVLVILILPTILGFCYFILPNIISTGSTGVSHISTEGYIYRDLYSNFLVLVPFGVFYILNTIKNKENSFVNLLFIISAIFTIYLLKRGLKGEVSSYYYFKMYFLIWILMLYTAAKSSFKIIDNKMSIYVCSYIVVYIVIILTSLLGIDGKITSINLLFNPNNYLRAYTDIYCFNYDKINSTVKIYSSNQINAINSLLEEEKDKSKILINAGPLQMLWAKDLTEITDTDDIHELIKEKPLDIQGWIDNENKKYLITLNKQDLELNDKSKFYRILRNEEDILILEKIEK